MVGGHETAHDHAAVVQDRSPQDLGGELRRGDLGDPGHVRKRIREGRRPPVAAQFGAAELCRIVAQPDDAAGQVGGGALAVRRREHLHRVQHPTGGQVALG